MDILVIDDDRDTRAGLVRVLERAGFMVTGVESGLQALATLQEHTAHAIVCDIRMAFLDGRQFYEELLTLHPDLATRVLFVTGHADEPDTARFLARTGRPCLTKPYDLDELVRCVRRLAQGTGRPSLPSLSTSIAHARGLPTAFRALSGSVTARVLLLMDRHWGEFPEPDRRNLAQLLMPVLEPLAAPGTEITDAASDRCAEEVRAWFHRTGGGPAQRADADPASPA